MDKLSFKKKSNLYLWWWKSNKSTNLCKRYIRIIRKSNLFKRSSWRIYKYRIRWKYFLFNKEYTLNEVCKIIRNEYEILTGNKSLDPKYVKDRPLEVKYAYCSHDKAKKLLGFNPNKTNLTKGIKNVLTWAIENVKDGVENRYFENLEITHNAPETWIKKLI